LFDFLGLKTATIEYLRQRKTSYFFGFKALMQRVKPTPQADMMIADLARFCRATSDITGTTDRETYILIGRRQVWLRIMEHHYLSPEELYDLYSRYKPPMEQDNG
jgi:hypothetical protein